LGQPLINGQPGVQIAIDVPSLVAACGGGGDAFPSLDVVALWCYNVMERSGVA